MYHVRIAYIQKKKRGKWCEFWCGVIAIQAMYQQTPQHSLTLRHTQDAITPFKNRPLCKEDEGGQIPLDEPIAAGRGGQSTNEDIEVFAEPSSELAPEYKHSVKLDSEIEPPRIKFPADLWIKYCFKPADREYLLSELRSHLGPYVDSEGGDLYSIIGGRYKTKWTKYTWLELVQKVFQIGPHPLTTLIQVQKNTNNQPFAIDIDFKCKDGYVSNFFEFTEDFKLKKGCMAWELRDCVREVLEFNGVLSPKSLAQSQDKKLLAMVVMSAHGIIGKSRKVSDEAIGKDALSSKLFKTSYRIVFSFSRFGIDDCKRLAKFMHLKYPRLAHFVDLNIYRRKTGIKIPGADKGSRYRCETCRQVRSNRKQLPNYDMTDVMKYGCYASVQCGKAVFGKRPMLPYASIDTNGYLLTTPQDPDDFFANCFIGWLPKHHKLKDVALFDGETKKMRFPQIDGIDFEKTYDEEEEQESLNASMKKVRQKLKKTGKNSTIPVKITKKTSSSTNTNPRGYKKLLPSAISQWRYKFTWAEWNLKPKQVHPQKKKQRTNLYALANNEQKQNRGAYKAILEKAKQKGNAPHGWWWEILRSILRPYLGQDLEFDLQKAPKLYKRSQSFSVYAESQTGACPVQSYFSKSCVYHFSNRIRITVGLSGVLIKCLDEDCKDLFRSPFPTAACFIHFSDTESQALMRVLFQAQYPQLRLE